MNDNIAVNEIFGPTIQGEGKNIGMPAVFLRLAGCNLRCVWCDTPYSWDKTRGMISQLWGITPLVIRINSLAGINLRNLVVTGGEPMLQQPNLYKLTSRMIRLGWWVEIETAGTIELLHPDLANLYTVSLKLGNSGNPSNKRIIPNAIRSYRDSGRAVWKFVARDPDDFGEISNLVDMFGLHPVYIMPEGITSEDIHVTMLQIVKQTIEHGYYLSNRLQVQLYGNTRGI